MYLSYWYRCWTIFWLLACLILIFLSCLISIPFSETPEISLSNLLCSLVRQARNFRGNRTEEVNVLIWPRKGHGSCYRLEKETSLILSDQKSRNQGNWLTIEQTQNCETEVRMTRSSEWVTGFSVCIFTSFSFSFHISSLRPIFLSGTYGWCYICEASVVLSVPVVFWEIDGSAADCFA